jgi:hypothetical protein
LIAGLLHAKKPCDFSLRRRGEDGFVGLQLLAVYDPDGNQLFFNYPNET